MSTPPVPPMVLTAERRAVERSFAHSCAAPAGALLAVLAASLRPGGRVLELGTGVGVGTAWIASGLEGREDVEVVTVELDEELADLVRDTDLPVTVLAGDAEELLPGLGTFDLVFADAPGGKWTGLDLTTGALALGGVLVVDDMDLARYHRPEDVAAVSAVRATLLAHPGLTSVELPVGTGLILSTRVLRPTAGTSM